MNLSQIGRTRIDATWETGVRRGAVLALAAACLGAALPAFTQTNISGCDEAELRAVLAAGGAYTFTRDCVILLTRPVVVDHPAARINSGGFKATISGDGTFSLFRVSGVLSLNNMTLTAGGGGEGGALHISPGGAVFMTNCALSGNHAKGLAGNPGISTTNTANTGANGGDGGPALGALGGAIFNLGALVADTCVFATNTAAGGAGGAGGAGAPGIWNGGLGGNGNTGGPGYGGAIYNQGELTLINCSFNGNSASGGQGGAGGAAGTGPFPGRPGIGGPGARAAGGGVYSLQTLSISGCTFAGNTIQAGGSAAGGGLENGNGSSGLPGADSYGGAVCSAGDCVVTNSTFTGNRATAGSGGDGGDGARNAGEGGAGGTAAGGGLLASSFTIAVNCTFAENAAYGGTNGLAGSGAAPANGRPGFALGGNIARTAGEFRLLNSIIGKSAGGGAAFGNFIDAKYNLCADGSILFSSPSQSYTDPKLAVLAGNGGPTLTMALLANSPALNKIPPDRAPLTDQRGLARPAGVKSDIGAFESYSFSPPTILSDPQNLRVAIGQPAPFTVFATGAEPLHYQWRLNGQPIAAATNTAYTLAGAQTANAGVYEVVVTNLYGARTSAPARLAIAEPTNAPLSVTIPAAAGGGFAPTNLALRFPTMSGYQYVLDMKTNLSDPIWIPIVTNFGTGGMLTNLQPTTGAPSRFYRVRAR